MKTLHTSNETKANQKNAINLPEFLVRNHVRKFSRVI